MQLAVFSSNLCFLRLYSSGVQSFTDSSSLSKASMISTQRNAAFGSIGSSFGMTTVALDKPLTGLVRGGREAEVLSLDGRILPSGRAKHSFPFEPLPLTELAVALESSGMVLWSGP